MSGGDLATKIEARRFVGREFLTWLWFESERSEGTLRTKPQGELGLWIEQKLVLSFGKEITQIKGKAPASARDAKEALRVGKLPERAGLHVTLGDRDFSFELRADTMALGAVALPAVLGKDDDEDGVVRFDDERKPRKKKQPRGADADDEQREAFYERMHLVAELEAVVEALFADFLALRLHDAWRTAVAPALARFCAGEPIDEKRYAAARSAALASRKR